MEKTAQINDQDNSSIKLKVDRKQWSLSDFKNNFNNKLLITDPEWQRNKVWSQKRRSNFIDSLLTEVPIPVIYLKKEKNKIGSTVYYVIDGKQRIETIVTYLNDEWSFANEKKKKKKKFSELPTSTQNDLLNTKLDCYELVNVNVDLLQKVFERINTAGVKLNGIEIQNCIYPGNLTKLIRELADSKDFKELVKDKVLKTLRKRMKDRYCILQFLAFYEWPINNQSIKGLSHFLDTFYRQYSPLTPEKEKVFRNVFKNAIQTAKEVFGNKPFQIDKGKAELNFGMFRYIAVSFTRYDKHMIIKNRDAIVKKHKDLIEKTHSLSNSQQKQSWAEIIRKAHPNSIRYACNTWENCLKEILGETAYLDTKRVFTTEEKQKLYEKDSTCQICKQHIPNVNLAEVDHIVPYAQGVKQYLATVGLYIVFVIKKEFLISKHG